MQDLEARTTETSQSEGRLKVDVGCPHGKKKCLKCLLLKNKKDGKGGPGYNAPGYGGNIKKSFVPKGFSIKSSTKSSKKIKFPRISGMKTVSSAIKSLKSKIKFGKIKSPKMKSLKNLLKKSKNTFKIKKIY